MLDKGDTKNCAAVVEDTKNTENVEPPPTVAERLQSEFGSFFAGIFGKEFVSLVGDRTVSNRVHRRLFGKNNNNGNINAAKAAHEHAENVPLLQNMEEGQGNDHSKEGDSSFNASGQGNEHSENTTGSIWGRIKSRELRWILLWTIWMVVEVVVF